MSCKHCNLPGSTLESILNVCIKQGKGELLCSELLCFDEENVGIYLDLYSSMAGVALILPESEGTPQLFLTDGKDGLG